MKPASDERPTPTPLAPAARAEAVRYGSAMLRHFGWFYRVLGLRRLLGRVTLDEASADHIRTAAAKGPVVYVLLRSSTLDHLALNTVLNRHRLPLSVWANGVTNFFWQPVVEAWKDVWTRATRLFRSGPRPHPIRSGWLSRTVASGAPVTLFLEDRPTVGDRFRRHAPADPMPSVLEAQEHTGRPVQLLPVVVVWDRSPERKLGPTRTFVQGSREDPGWIGALRNLLLGSRNAFVQVGEPVDLHEFDERVDEPRRARALRILLRRYLRREAQLVRGPTLLPHADMRRLVLDNPPMRELARREAEATGRRPEQIRRLMEKDLDAIAARFKWWVIQLLNYLLQPLWTKVFRGVDVRDEDMERIRMAMRRGTAVLVPCHKSHFDYVLLSWVFFRHGLIVPHVVAGMNLAIWPISIFLRGAGGFFIKRTFAGERIFPAVFSRYLRELIRHGYPVEFFIEGGRTRSGKLLPPRLGVLGMVLDAAALRSRGTEVTLLPIALAYEQVAEETAYARELGGEEKKPETVGQLVKARSVLKRRFGRVYLRVGEPVACSELVDDPDWTERDRSEQKDVLLPLGERLVHRIGRATVVLPTSLVALALLAHHRRGIRHGLLVERVDRFRAFLQREGGMEAASMAHFSQARNEALDRFRRAGLVEGFEHDGERVWGIAPDQRIQLDFYKNQLLHFFAPAAYATAAIRALDRDGFTLEDVRPGFLLLVWSLRQEFILDPDRSATDLLGDGLDALVAHGALAVDEGRYAIADTGRIGEVHGLLRSLLEGYVAVLRALPDHPRLERKELVKAVQADTAALLATGAITRPESLSRVTVENAVRSFLDEGILERDPRDRLVPVEARRRSTLEALVPMVE